MSEHRGDAAGAIAFAEEKLVRQNSVAAMVDLQVVSAVMNARLVSLEGRERLSKLQREIEGALHSRTDLDTPAGARDFQRFLIGKLRDIRDVVHTANLDSTSRAALAAAWATLYEVSRDSPGDSGSSPSHDAAPARANGTPVSADELDGPLWTGSEGDMFSDLLASEGLGDLYPAEPPPPPVAAPAAPTAPGIPASGGGGTPGLATPLGPGPFGPGSLGVGDPPRIGAPHGDDGLLAAAERLGLFDDLPPWESEDGAADAVDTVPDLADEFTDGAESAALESVTVSLPNGETITAPSPPVAAAMQSAVGGTPIAEAFRQQGMSIPPVGTRVAEPVPVQQLLPGDVGVFVDRHAMALDTEDALIGGRIEPVAFAAGPEFLGWMHPPPPAAEGSAPSQPAQTRPAGTATMAR